MDYAKYYDVFQFTGAKPKMRDIYELIRQKESDLERIKREVDVLRMAAKLLDDDAGSRTIVVAPAAADRESQGYGAPAVARPGAAPTAPPSAWASAKQFP